MRRLLALTPAVLLLTAALGCYHTVGICDCGPDQSANSCCAPHFAAHVIKSEPIKVEPIKAEPSKAEPIKALPKVEGK